MYAVTCRASFFPCHLPNLDNFSSQLLRLCDILVMGLVPLLMRKKLDVRLVMLGTCHRRFCKCFEKEARGVLIPAGFSYRKFLTQTSFHCFNPFSGLQRNSSVIRSQSPKKEKKKSLGKQDLSFLMFSSYNRELWLPGGNKCKFVSLGCLFCHLYLLSSTSTACICTESCGNKTTAPFSLPRLSKEILKMNKKQTNQPKQQKTPSAYVQDPTEGKHNTHESSEISLHIASIAKLYLKVVFQNKYDV